jgi:hypothetical protein
VSRANAALFWVSAIALAGSLVWLSLHGPTGHGPVLFIPVYCLSFAAMAGVWHWWPFKHPTALLCVLIAGIAARALFLPYPQSDDVYRYLWEGRVQDRGFNPYIVAPGDPRLADLRTPYWPSINHHDMPAAYGPVAEVLFRGIAAVSETPAACKLTFALFDVAVTILLFYLLLLAGAPARNIILYALNPLALIAIAGEGHLESMAVLFVVAALVAREKRAFMPMYLLLGMAAAVKLPYAIVLPFFVSRRNIRFGWSFIPPLCLYGLYAADPSRLMYSLVRFGSAFHSNGLAYSLLSVCLTHQHSVIAIAVLLAVTLLVMFFLVPDPYRACLMACGAFLVCSTTVHPWYLFMMLPFAVLFASMPWVVWCATIGFTFVTVETCRTTGIWSQSGWILAAEYGPVILLAYVVWLRQLQSGLKRYDPPKSVAIVIPVLNEKSSILQCIASVRDQTRKPERIFIVDGGSVDGTLDTLGNQDGITVCSGHRGRGTQIAVGYDRALQDVIVILHADSVLSPTAIETLMDSLAAHPFASGGAFGSHFASTKASFRIVDALNNFRARVLGISFGDQVQFVRRAALQAGFPDYLLMEDVELAFRIRESGAHLFVGKGVVSSPRRWNKHGYFPNIVAVIGLTSLFIALRKFGMVTDRCRWFYGVYYGKGAEAP